MSTYNIGSSIEQSLVSSITINIPHHESEVCELMDKYVEFSAEPWSSTQNLAFIAYLETEELKRLAELARNTTGSSKITHSERIVQFVES